MQSKVNVVNLQAIISLRGLFNPEITNDKVLYEEYDSTHTLLSENPQLIVTSRSKDVNLVDFLKENVIHSDMNNESLFKILLMDDFGSVIDDEKIIENKSKVISLKGSLHMDNDCLMLGDVAFGDYLRDSFGEIPKEGVYVYMEIYVDFKR